jgi:hypothetical protein
MKFRRLSGCAVASPMGDLSGFELSAFELSLCDLSMDDFLFVEADGEARNRARAGL